MTQSIERRAANEFALRRRSDRLEVSRFEIGEHKVIDLAPRPLRIADLRTRRLHWGLKCPELAGGREVDSLGSRRRLLDARVGGPLIDPGREVGDDCVREFSLRRHLERLLLQGLNEQTLFCIAGNDRRPGVASLEQGRAAIERESPLDALGLGRMALVTLTDQDGANLALKEFDLRRRRLRSTRRVRDGADPTEEE